MARLPSGYKELEYIQSSKTQYIDTGFKPNNNTRVVMDSEFLATPSGNTSLFGARTAANSKNYAMLFIQSSFRSDYNDVYSQTWAVAATTRRIYDKNKETTTIDGTAKSYNNSSFQADYTILLFALNAAGTVKWFASMRLYACQIYDNGTLIRDYIPCANADGVIGLYDLVTAAFFSNAGTGTFTAGPEVPEGPDTPKDLAATVADTGAVTLTWSASTGAAGYRVYLDGGLLADTTQTTATAQLSPFGAALFAVSAYNEDGESDRAFLAVYFRPGQPLLYLITDRALADVDRIGQLAARINAGTATVAEQTEWASDLKGAYNASDLNRVGAAVAYVAGRLNGYGYAVTVNPKQDWTGSDIPTAGQMAGYLRDVAALRGAIAVMDSTPPTPDSASGLTWQEANNIEQILLDVDELLTRMAAAWFYSGDLYAGEV